MSEFNTIKQLGPQVANTVQPQMKEILSPHLQSEASQLESNRDIQIEVKKLNFRSTKTKRSQKIGLVDKCQQPQRALSIIPSNSNFLKQMKQKEALNRFKSNLLTKAYIYPKNPNMELEEVIEEKYIQSPSKTTHFQQQNSGLPVWQPNNWVLFIWDFTGIIVSLMGLWLCPFLASFCEDDYLAFDTEIILILFYLAIDKPITCNRAIINQGEVITNRMYIIKQYLQNYAVQDVVSFVLWGVFYHRTLDIIVLYDICIIIQIVLLVMRLVRTISTYFEAIQMKSLISEFIDLLILIVMIYYFAHIMACIWHYVALKSQYLGTSWIENYGLVDEIMWVRYNYAFYWATMTMVTVGYGDITAQNQIEMLCSNVMMFFSSCMFAYSMNSIGIILKNIQDAKQKYKRSLMLMNSYMSRNLVDNQIQSRVRNYLKYYFNEDNIENAEEILQLRDNLPNGLQKELNTNIQTRIANQIQSLTDHFSQSTIKQVGDKLEIVKFAPDDYIFTQQNQEDQYLYFIDQGQVCLCEQQSGKILQTIDQGDSFGQFQFFTGLQPKTSAKSMGFSQIYKISRSAFLNIIQYTQDDFHKFHWIKDEINMNQRNEVIKLACSFCQLPTHFSIDCPKILYRPDIEQRIKKESFVDNMPRKQYHRLRNERISSLIYQKKIHTVVQELQKSLFEQNTLSQATSEIQEESDQSFNEESRQSLVIQPSNSHKEQPRQSLNVPDLRFKQQTIGLDLYVGSANVVPIQKSITAISGPKDKVIEPRFVVKSLDLSEQLMVYFDKPSTSSIYYPQGNLDQVLKNLQKKHSKKYLQRQENTFKEISKYTFYYRIKLLIFKYREHFSKYKTQVDTRTNIYSNN